MFSRLGTWCHDRRRLVLGLWLAVLVLGGAVSGAAGTAFRDEFNLPDVESRAGFDILDEHFGGEGTGQVGRIVFRAEQGVDDPWCAARCRRCSTRSPASRASPA